MIRFIASALVVVALGCGNGSGSSATGSCGGANETSCDVPNDNGLHTCYDYVVGGAVTLDKAKMDCTSAGAGTVLSACCDHSSAVGRCVFQPTEGGTSTEWFLSGSVGAAQAACASKNGVFTAM